MGSTEEEALVSCLVTLLALGLLHLGNSPAFHRNKQPDTAGCTHTRRETEVSMARHGKAVPEDTALFACLLTTPGFPAAAPLEEASPAVSH